MSNTEIILNIIEIIVQSIIGVGLLWVAYEANKIAKINNRRLSAEERKKIEEIFDLYMQSSNICFQSGSCSDLESIDSLRKAKNMADLYGLDSIKEHLDKIIDVYNSAYVLYGNSEGNFNEKDRARYNELKGMVYDYLIDRNCFHEHLKINE